MSVAPEFDEVWRWDGWTTFNESLSGGAVDSEGNVVLAGTQGFQSEQYNAYDDTFFNVGVSGDSPL